MISGKKVILVAVIMIFTAFSLKYVNHSEDIEPRKSFHTFPVKMGKWNGNVGYFDQSVYDLLGVDDSILSNYHSPDGGDVQLYIGFYKSQREGDLIHSPKNCMPGSGWNITKVVLEDVAVPDYKRKTINVIKLILEKGTEKRIVLYWFHSRGRIINSEYWQKIYLVIDSITRNRTDGSFVRLISPVINDEETALNHLKEFVRVLMPYLDEYIPS